MARVAARVAPKGVCEVVASGGPDLRQELVDLDA